MKKSIRLLVCLAGLSAVVAIGATARERTVDINKISEKGVGEKIGTVAVTGGPKGTTFKVSVTGIPAGEHGFHVHEKGDCGPGMKDGKMQAGIAAGGHFDPKGTKSHAGPQGEGHAGDLPKLEATDKGIEQTVVAPRLEVADIEGRALMIHEGGDTYGDKPESGGGKGRIACGVIPKG